MELLHHLIERGGWSRLVVRHKACVALIYEPSDPLRGIIAWSVTLRKRVIAHQMESPVDLTKSVVGHHLRDAQNILVYATRGSAEQHCLERRKLQLASEQSNRTVSLKLLSIARPPGRASAAALHSGQVDYMAMVLLGNSYKSVPLSLY